MDTPYLDKSNENLSIINELPKYDALLYFSTDEKLITKYGPMLFFKENEKEFPTLSDFFPSSALSITGNTQTKLRNSLNPNQLKNLNLLKMNR
jgi:hypothetical protein